MIKKSLMVFTLFLVLLIAAACTTTDAPNTNDNIQEDINDDNGDPSNDDHDNDVVDDNDNDVVDDNDNDVVDDNDNDVVDDNDTDDDNDVSDDTSDDDELREFTLDELSHYDGKDGKDAYIAVDGFVYDVTNSSLWTDGTHRGSITAGQDLTEAMDNNVRHGREMLDRIPLIGILVEGSTDLE